MAALTKIGNWTVVAAADLADKTHPINSVSDARVGSEGVGKRAGYMVLRDNGSADYDLVIALGSDPTSKWVLFEAGTQVTPS